LQFDGSNDLISRTNDADFDFGTGSFSISGWFKHPSSQSGTDTILARYSTAGFKIYMDSSGFICFAIDDDATWAVKDDACSTTSYADSKWHHFAAVKATTASITLYIDGRQVDQDASLAATGSLSNTVTMYWGIDSDGTSNPWTGFLDNLTVYNYERVAEQVKADAVGPIQTSVSMGSAGKDTLTDGLVGWWKMDETAANSCTGGANDSCDSSGNAFDGAWNGNTTSASGKFGNGTTYDGTGDYTSSSFNLNILKQGQEAGAFTLSTWLQLDTIADDMVMGRTGFGGGILARAAGLDFRMFFELYDSTFGLTSINANLPSNTTGWHLLTATYDNRQMRLFIDGVMLNSGSFPAGSQFYSWDNNFYIGGDTGSSVDGKLDDTRVYNRALSSVEVRQLYNWSAGPVGYWPMDENTGTSTVNDKSGNGHTGTMAGSMTADDWVPGKFGSALAFDGSNDVIGAGNGSSLQITGPVTLEAWVKFDSFAATNAILSKHGSATNRAYQLSITSGANIRMETSADGVDANMVLGTGTTALSTGTWYHVAGVYIPSTSITLYINGIQDGQNTTSIPAALFNGSGNFGIGAQNENTRFFPGTVDDVRVYNYARTPAQIVADMNGGHPVGGSPVGSAVGYWRLDDATGTTAQDGSTATNNNDLTLNSASWNLTGKFAGAWNGTGGDIRMSRATDADLEFSATDNFAISFWYRSDSATNPAATEYLIANGGPASLAGYAVYANTSGNLCFGIDDDTTWGPDIASCTTDDLYDGNWHHLLATRDQTGTDTTYIYIDGILKDSDVDTTTATLDSDVSFFVGDMDTDNAGSGEEFAGDIDELKVYRAAFAADQVQLEYNHGKATTLGSTGTTSGGLADNSQAREFCLPGDTTACSAPVGWWKMDENTENSCVGGTNDICDSSGNGNNGTLSSAFRGSGKYGPGVKTNSEGSQTQVSISDPASGILDFTNTQDYTLEAWVKLTGNEASNTYFISKNYDGDPAKAGYAAILQDAGGSQNLICTYSGGGGLGTEDTGAGTGNLFDGKWHHVACIMDRDGGQMGAAGLYAYIDGRRHTSDNTLTIGSAANSVALTIGESSTSAELTSGGFDEVRVYDYARTPAQIALDYNRGAPLGWYRMDECTGSTIFNAAKNGNDEAIGSNGTWAGITSGTNTAVGTCVSGSGSEAWSNGSAGRRNASLDFDGTNDTVDMNDVANYDFIDGQNFSIAAWVYRDDFASDDTIVAKKNDQLNSTAGFTVWIDDSTDDVRMVVSDGDSANLHTIDSTATITATGWNHMVIVYDDSGASASKIYINGRDNTATNTTTGTFSSIASLANSVDFRIGSESNDDQWFSGQIDDVRIYNYALTAKQAGVIYNEGAVHFGN
jgi:hypothetical protein